MTRCEPTKMVDPQPVCLLPPQVAQLRPTYKNIYWRPPTVSWNGQSFIWKLGARFSRLEGSNHSVVNHWILSSVYGCPLWFSGLGVGVCCWKNIGRNRQTSKKNTIKIFLKDKWMQIRTKHESLFQKENWIYLCKYTRRQWKPHVTDVCKKIKTLVCHRLPDDRIE